MFHLHSTLRTLSILALIVVLGARAQAQSPTATAEYRITFDATWSEATHPLDFPGSAHFSGLIGGTHQEAVSFWTPDTLASPGIEAMAERGSKTLLREELQAAIDDGSAGEVVSGGGIGRSPGVVSDEFLATVDYPLVTIVSMIAPSPDWFVGVHGLNLMQGGDWASELVVELHAYDAGTDSGSNYTSANDDTMPREAIARLTDGPFANGVALGTFTFTRLDAPPVRQFVRGDVNADTVLDISDAVANLLYLFVEGEEPPCLTAADVDNSGTIDLGDAIRLLNYLFLEGGSPAAPFPDCGAHSAEDALSCQATSPACA